MFLVSVEEDNPLFIFKFYKFQGFFFFFFTVVSFWPLKWNVPNVPTLVWANVTQKRWQIIIDYRQSGIVLRMCRSQYGSFPMKPLKSLIYQGQRDLAIKHTFTGLSNLIKVLLPIILLPLARWLWSIFQQLYCSSEETCWQTGKTGGAAIQSEGFCGDWGEGVKEELPGRQQLQAAHCLILCIPLPDVWISAGNINTNLYFECFLISLFSLNCFSRRAQSFMDEQFQMPIGFILVNKLYCLLVRISVALPDSNQDNYVQTRLQVSVPPLQPTLGFRPLVMHCRSLEPRYEHIHSGNIKHKRTHTGRVGHVIPTLFTVYVTTLLYDHWDIRVSSRRAVGLRGVSFPVLPGWSLLVQPG